MKSWIAPDAKFIRVKDLIKPVAIKPIPKNSIIFCELPTSSKGFHHGSFLSACSKIWGDSNIILPCIFNSELNKIDDDGTNCLFSGCKKRNRVDQLCLTLDNLSKCKEYQENLYITIQIFPESKSGNCGKVILPNGNVFLVSLVDIDKGDELIIDDTSDIGVKIKFCIMYKSFGNSDMNSNTEDVLKDAFLLFDKCKPLKIPSENEICDMKESVKDYSIRKHLGFVDFAKQMDVLKMEVDDFTNGKCPGIDELEKEFESIVKRANLDTGI